MEGGDIVKNKFNNASLSPIAHWIFGSILILLAFSVQAQTYAYKTEAFNWVTPSGSATAVAWDGTCTSYDGGDDDKAVANFPGGFTFPFAGTTYSQVRIMSNGMVQFGADAGLHRTFTNTTLPIGMPSNYGGGCPRSVPENVLVVYWLDINSSPNVANAPVYYELIGSAPNRRFVVTWNNVALYGNTSRRYSFQVILNEDGTFVYQYTTGASDGSDGTIGVQVNSTDYTLYAYEQPFIDPTSGTAIKWYRADQAQPKTAEYYFDEASWNPSPSTDVRDASGNGLHGMRIGSAQSSNTRYRVCRSANIPNNTAAATQDAISISYVPASAGSVSFWYYPLDNNVAMLFDATTVANRPFYLMKTSGRQISLRVTDTAGASVTATTTLSTAQRISSGSWRHIAASWYMQAGTNQTVLRIYIDGVLNIVERDTTNGVPGSVTNAYIGDNRTSGVTPSGGTVSSADGYIDEMKIYPFDMSNAQAARDMELRSGCSSLDHFDVTVSPASALTCEWAGVTITARDAVGAAVQSSATVSLTSSSGHGDWRQGSATGVFAAGAAGSGTATYTFNNEASVTLLFNTRYAETTTLTATATPWAGSGSAIFAHAGFKLVTASMTPATISKKVACVDSNLGYGGSPGQTAQTLYLQAWKSNLSTDGYVCSAANQDFQNGQTAAVNFSMQCVNPTTCVAGTNATVNGTQIGLAPTAAGRPASGDYKPVTLTFGANAMSPVRFNYPDAGQVQLWASYNPAGAPSDHMNGVSNPFTVAPASFAITSVTNSGGGANPIAWPSGSTPTLATTAFTFAGDPLSVMLQARNACATPGITANFGNETPAESRYGGGAFAFATNVSTPSLNSPAPVMITAPVFVNGVTTGASASPASVRWNEVGALKATVTLSEYFKDEDNNSIGPVSGTSDWIGRFTPHHFDMVITPVTGCTGFAYSRQPFKVEVTARALGGGATQNYHAQTDGFAKNVSLTEDSGAAGDLYVGTTAGGGNALPDTVFTNGVGTVSISAANPISFRFTAEPTAPAEIKVHAEDADTLPSKATNGGTNGSINIYSGRLWLGNAYGSDKKDLTVPYETQYWNGTAFIKNTADNCTALATANFSLGNQQGDLAVAPIYGVSNL
ncbi:MAG: hypothetical protein H6R18_990, partial [Proteobacteria bacterium]|nr:hypothetical protein [Pseudomonadota bacterium]